MNRRKFIRIIGAGGAAGLLLGGGALWAGTRGGMPDSAIAPWTDPGQGMTDVRLKAAAFAMLAPNPHNIQPWRLRLVGEDRLRLHVDLARLLPHTDPPGRQILIGQGTFLELFRMAAAEMGYRAEMTLFPDGPFAPERLDDRAVADIRLVADSGVARDPLFRHALARRSNKEPFDTSRSVNSAALDGLRAGGYRAAALVTTSDGATVQALRDLTQKALSLEIATPHTMQESIDLMRIGPKEVAANPDGIDLLGPMMWWGARAGLVDRKDMATPGSQAFQIGLDMARDQAQTAMAHAWLVTPDNSRLSQLQAGMDYMRLNLKASELGLALHPMSQLLQEYPEMTDLQREAFGVMRTEAPAYPQMLVRLGHAAAPGPSPRRPVRAIVAA